MNLGVSKGKHLKITRMTTELTRQDAVRDFVKIPSRALQVDRVFWLGFRGRVFPPVREVYPSPVF